ncbi:MAG: enolase C-terminal domain-like protein, partial [Burkholderiales bacterium]|nr:enolase C-terminal domain-like protein [Burkholderiales bacterium]
IGKDGPGRANLIAENFHSYPFLLSGINECVLDLCDDTLISPLSEDGWFELAATVNTLDAAEAVQIAKQYVDSGYATLKVKVGIEARSDADRVTRIYEAVKGKAKLRVDANRNFSPDAAYEFAVNVPIEAIEYFEQPFASSNWQATESLATRSPIPLMLDESIYGPDDIKRVAKTACAKAVKLKMSKVGGPRALYEQIKLARGLGLDVIVGNGVASDFACYREALCCSRTGVTTAGEMNGFLKLVAPILSEPLRMMGARLILPAGTTPKLSEEAISNFSINQARFS